MAATLGFRDLGLIDYETAWHAMKRFTDERGREAADEVWLVQHPPVFTQDSPARPSICCCRVIFLSYRSIVAAK